MASRKSLVFQLLWLLALLVWLVYMKAERDGIAKAMIALGVSSLLALVIIGAAVIVVAAGVWGYQKLWLQEASPGETTIPLDA